MAALRAFGRLVVKEVPPYLVACFLLISSSARAQTSGDADTDLASMREMVTFARFDEVIPPLVELLERDDLSAAQRVSALELLAAARVIERSPQAEETLELLFSRDPGHRLSLPDVSPQLFAAFSRARENGTAAMPVRLAHDVPSTLSRGDPTVEVRIEEGLDAVHVVRLSYREGTAGYQRMEMRLASDGSARARIPLVAEGGGASVEYYVEALAPSATLLASAGSADEPFRVAVGALGSSGIPNGDDGDEPGTTDGGGDDTWWIVTLVTLLAVGAGVGIGVGVFLATDESQGPPDGSLGTFVLGLTFD